MSITYTKQRETWAFNNASPLQTASVTWIAEKSDGSDITLDDIEADEGVGKPVVGQQLGSRLVYAKSVSWSQQTPRIAEASVSYDSVLFNPASYSSTEPQTVEKTVAGYVNTSLSAYKSSASWWRWQSPSGWVDGGSYPWTTATPDSTFQTNIEDATSTAVDSGGTPLVMPVLGQQLTISLTFDSKPTSLRAYWRSLRGTRNSSTFLNDGVGEWLFTGANQKATTTSSLYTVELSFYRDPYGWCRQRAKADANGKFTLENTIELDTPSGNTCGDSDKIRVASCVYWVQLHPALGDFSNLLTSEQMSTVEDLIA